MNKIRKIVFKDHPILNDLCLDFCDKSGHAASTIIIAGENGCGKSTLLDCIYKIASNKIDFACDVELEIDNKVVSFIYYRKPAHPGYIWINDNLGLDEIPGSDVFLKKYHFNGIFSDIDITFNSKNVSSVTSLDIDIVQQSRRSNNNLSSEIKQLLIDVQSLDDAAISLEYRKAKEEKRNIDDINLKLRMPRFTTAFNKMFNNKLKYDRIENTGQNKSILFKKGTTDIPIDSLSSGEKQIVYRGCFLLKDINALNGTFVFIDEPEISLHPTWQKEIMDYYKAIFSTENGQQTSQIFTVTHSPFIIHNNSRKDDKVIVLKRDYSDKITILDKAEYYNYTSVEVIEDAFSINDFASLITSSNSTVYLEGQTDEKYFNKALEVYGYTNIPFKFRCVGYTDDNGNEINTGKDNLNKAAQFLISQKYSFKNICLFDCDTNKSTIIKNNVVCKSIAQYNNSKNLKSGIENALVLDEIDLNSYYTKKQTFGNYGEENTISTFNKALCCDSICSMKNQALEKVFINIKNEIDQLLNYFN